MANTQGQLLLYQEDGVPQVQVTLYDGSVWLTQAQMAELFQKSVPTINEHIKNIYEEGELESEATIRNSRIVRLEGNRSVEREIEHYNLDVIISVGYRVKSHVGTHFRIWATKRLNEFVTKGFVMDDARLSGNAGNYFDELVERVRKIRTSEKNFYTKIKDVFATSIDYDGNTAVAKEFFATVQNNFHYAIHGHTAAELIMERADSKQPYMGLTSWKGKNVTLQEATVAKNYLEEDEIKRLELLVEQFLAFAELRSVEKTPMYMSDWVKKLHAFFEFNDKAILEGSGKVSHAKMESHVKKQLEAHNRSTEAAAGKPAPALAKNAKKDQKQLKGYKSK